MFDSSKNTNTIKTTTFINGRFVNQIGGLGKGHVHPLLCSYVSSITIVTNLNTFDNYQYCNLWKPNIFLKHNSQSIPLSRYPGINDLQDIQQCQVCHISMATAIANNNTSRRDHWSIIRILYCNSLSLSYSSIHVNKQDVQKLAYCLQI